MVLKCKSTGIVEWSLVRISLKVMCTPLHVCVHSMYFTFVEAAVRQSGVEGSECGGGGGSLAEEELRSLRKPLLHLTHAMIGVSQ